MSALGMEALFELDVPERLRLIQDLWDSIVRDTSQGEDLPLSDTDRAMLEEAVREDDENPEGVVPWSVVRAELLRK